MSLIKNLSLKYPDFEIEVPYWEILDKGVTVLSGPSGSGKSSLFRILLGLERPTSGAWQFNGIDLLKIPTEQRKLGVVFQTWDVFPHMTALENILFAAEARNISKEKTAENLKKFSDILKMNTFLERKASLLSGGEKQRVALARALIAEPRCLLLDEPFSALDQGLRSESRTLLRQVIAEYSIPTILVTHDPQDIDSLADKVSYIENGKISHS